MRLIIVSTLALAMTASAGAIAQTQSGASGAGSASQAAQHSARSAKAVEDSLKQAGIQDVKTIDAAYLVSAKTKDGERVTIFIDPPNRSNTASTSGSSAQASNQGMSGQQAMSGQQQVKDSLQKAGFSEVNVMDAAYLVTGKTKDGDQVTMMIDPSMTTGNTSAGRPATAGSSAAGGNSSNAGADTGSTVKK